VSWESLPGNDRIRFCGQCRLNVYNLAILTPREVEAIVRKTKGRLCGRLYVREDNTATVRDCPRGTVARRVRRAWTAAAVLVLAVVGWLLRMPGDADRTVHPGGVQTLLKWVAPDPVPQGRMLMGEVPVQRPTPPPPPSQSLPQ
ncbi:MAG: hypothetical protein HY293_19030, partial [Planctomycetes bacterium]|nr:hypothetical protein [Planctomycetota bacterium]